MRPLRSAVRVATIAGVLGFAGLLARPSPAGPIHKYPWERPPGPIAGKWKTTTYPNDMVVEITVRGKTATGRIVALGDGGKRHYTQGEEILNLEVNDFGHWVGQLRYKTLSGIDRKDPIHFVASPNELDAIMTTDDTFKHMPRVP